VNDTDLAITFFTLLTLVANAATLGLWGLAAAPARPRWSALRIDLMRNGLTLAWLVAAVSMSGSLWFSEVAGFQPCRLCWFQRACMYPLVLVLGVAIVRRRRPGAVGGWADRLALGLASVGAVIAAYHVLVERFPQLESSACDPTRPCSLVWFQRLGFVTLPYMALSGFVVIVTLLLSSRPARVEAFA
jgi:disulfide bond formation protein DsbB